MGRALGLTKSFIALRLCVEPFVVLDELNNFGDASEKPDRVLVHIFTERCDSNWATPSKDCASLCRRLLLHTFRSHSSHSDRSTSWNNFFKKKLCMFSSLFRLIAVTFHSFIQLVVWSVSGELKSRFVSHVTLNVIFAWSCLIYIEFLGKLCVKWLEILIHKLFWWVLGVLAMTFRYEVMCEEKVAF